MIGLGKGFNLKRSWFNAGIGGDELPIGFGMVLVAVALPSGD